MERLTQRANGFIQLIGTGTKISLDCILPITKGTIKLAEYEDTGLTPEEIRNLISINENLVRVNDKLNQRHKHDMENMKELDEALREYQDI